MSTYTEEEAKAKWCHRLVFEGQASGPCIASGCMAWRWKARFGTDPENPENCAVLPSTHGYCGLAGRPQ